MAKSTAVILVNYKKPGYTIACVKSLFEFCNKELFDVIIVDNGSADGSVEIIKGYFPELTYIEETDNLGFAEGNNKGLRVSIARNYKYSLILNNDTIVKEDLIGKLVYHLDTYPMTAAVQPAIYWMYEPTKLWNGPGYYHKWKGNTYNKNDLSAQHQVNSFSAEWLTGCCMLVRNEALIKAGLFNSKFFLYYEDVELSYRLRNKAGRLDYLPTGKLYHEAGVSGKNETQTAEGTLTPIIHYYFSRNRLWFVRKYGVVALYPFNLISILGYYTAVWAYLKVKGRKEKASYVLRGIKDGLFTPKRQIWVND